MTGLADYVQGFMTKCNDLGITPFLASEFNGADEQAIVLNGTDKVVDFCHVNGVKAIFYSVLTAADIMAGSSPDVMLDGLEERYAELLDERDYDFEDDDADSMFGDIFESVKRSLLDAANKYMTALEKFDKNAPLIFTCVACCGGAFVTADDVETEYAAMRDNAGSLLSKYCSELEMRFDQKCTDMDDEREIEEQATAERVRAAFEDLKVSLRSDNKLLSLKYKYERKKYADTLMEKMTKDLGIQYIGMYISPGVFRDAVEDIYKDVKGNQ